MNKNYPFAELRQRLDSASRIIILLPKNPFFDQVAAALSLSLSLEAAGKPALVVCPSPMTVEFNRLVGVNKITEKAQGSDLIISFNYSPDQIERVSYNDDNNQPNVVIQPKAGAPRLSEGLASFSYTGSGADLIFTVGLKSPNQAGDTGLGLEGSFVVNLDTDPANLGFGQLNVVDLEAASLSEVVFGLIAGLALPFDADIAQNLLAGLWRRTQGLSSATVGADTYETAAVCLRAGAQKPLENVARKDEVFTPKARFEPRPSPTPAKEVVKPVENQKPVEDKKAPEVKEEKGVSKPPADWFEPKIFKGNSIS